MEIEFVGGKFVKIDNLFRYINFVFKKKNFVDGIISLMWVVFFILEIFLIVKLLFFIKMIIIYCFLIFLVIC